MRKIRVYTDYKSPYAYLAKDLVYELERDTGVTIEWLPYTLDIPSYLGSAELDASGAVVAQSRNAHQWRRVKYSYMDCRREANRRGMTIRGTTKIWDSSLANIGLVFAGQQGLLRPYHDRVFERFWKRDLDIEDVAVLTDLLRDCGAPRAQSFPDWARDEGRALLRQIQTDAEAAGVFGVPSFLLDNGDLYWGREHISRITELLGSRRA
jgi:2-hydroxychromene-2-carboxylate isomerase